MDIHVSIELIREKHDYWEELLYAYSFKIDEKRLSEAFHFPPHLMFFTVIHAWSKM